MCFLREYAHRQGRPGLLQFLRGFAARLLHRWTREARSVTGKVRWGELLGPASWLRRAPAILGYDVQRPEPQLKRICLLLCLWWLPWTTAQAQVQPIWSVPLGDTVADSQPRTIQDAYVLADGSAHFRSYGAPSRDSLRLGPNGAVIRGQEYDELNTEKRFQRRVRPWYGCHNRYFHGCLTSWPQGSRSSLSISRRRGLRLRPLRS